MDYFLVTQDDEFKGDKVFKLPRFINYRKLLKTYDFDYSKALENEFLYVEDEYVFKKYKDIYTSEFPIISENFYVFFKEFFKENIVFKNVIITDNEVSSQLKYYYPALNKVDCLNKETKLNSFNTDIDVNRLKDLDLNMIGELILDYEKVTNLNLDAFYIENFKKDIMVVNLYIAELILRKRLNGVALKRLKIK
ncbi:hypothetical protein WG909_11395 [Peptostreptococcaceae bacterium AGR-M142]